MAKYTFNHTSNITITTDIDNISRKLGAIIQKGIPKIGLKASRTIIYPVFVYEAKKFIQQGGAERGEYAWGYWRRKRGGSRNFQYVDNARSSWFSDRWRHKGKAEVRYPIHPRSYMRFRKERKAPRSNQYALYDTSRLINGFFVSAEYTRARESTMHIRNWYARLDRHEEGTNVPQRMVIEPVSKILEADTVLQSHIMNYVREEIKKILEENRK